MMNSETEKTYDYIVVGSGFGGSVSSMRLAEKGFSVLTIEKGRWFKTHDFPKTNWNVKKYFWFPMIGFLGFQKLNLFKHALILSGTGVGGGSLVYANTLMKPHSKFFSSYDWARLNDWEKVLEPCYETVAQMLGRVKFEDKNYEDRILHEVATDMHMGDSFKNVYVGVYFNDDKSPRDPYFNGEGPLRTPCTQCAGCMVGCRENAKNTLDKNYLWFAQKYGAEIKAETQVYKIEYKDGFYHVYTCSSKGFLKTRKSVFRSKNLVISAGVLGTLKLLLNQKFRTKTLPLLSEKTGEGVRTNSETLCTATFSKTKMNNGVAITSIFNPDENTSIEIVKYPDGSNLMRTLLTLAVDKKGSSVKRVFHFVLKILTRPVLFMRMFFNSKWATNTIIFLVMQSSESKMNMMLKKWPFRSRITLKNTEKENVKAYIPVGQQVMNSYAQKTGAYPQNSTAEILLNIPSTAHILGGIPMGDTPENGVINKYFEVFGYPGMYIIDGSVIQGNPGVNPSFTIAALAEYAMKNIQPKF